MAFTGFPNGRFFDGLLTNPTLQQILDYLRILSPVLTPLAITLFNKKQDIAALLYRLYYTTNFNPRMAGDHYLSLMLKLVKDDHTRFIKMRELSSQTCEGAIEISTALKYLELKGYIETEGKPKITGFSITEKGLKQAQRVTFRFSQPGFALTYGYSRLEQVVSGINSKLGRKNIL